MIAGYYVDFKDRIIALANGSGIQGNPAILQNVGDVRSWGVEAAGTLRVTPELALFASYAFNDSEYRDDVVNAAGVIVAFWVTYWRGRRDAQRDSRLEGMRDNERAQRQANEVQRDVASRSDADVAGGLRRWNRD